MTPDEVSAGGREARAPLHFAHLIALALILAAAALLYIPGLSDPFFAADYLFLDQVRDRPLATALVTPDPLSNFYRPVSRQLYFWLVSHLSGESFVAFHATSIVLFGFGNPRQGSRAEPVRGMGRKTMMHESDEREAIRIRRRYIA